MSNNAATKEDDTYFFRDIYSKKLNTIQDIINSAEEIAKNKLNKISTSQFRNYLDQFIEAKGNTPINPEELKNETSASLHANEKIQFQILRPKFAYTVTRASKSGDKSALKSFNQEIVDKWIKEGLSTKKDLERLHLFLESLVAYHKVYSK